VRRRAEELFQEVSQGLEDAVDRARRFLAKLREAVNELRKF